MAFADCIAEIKKRAGRDVPDELIEAMLGRVEARARRLARDLKIEARAAYDEAAKNLAEEAALAAAIEKRNRVLDIGKRIERRRFYATAPDVVTGIEARLVGVNRPFAGARASADATANAMKADLVLGVTADLDRAGLYAMARDGAHDAHIREELWQLSLGERGRPGATGNQAASDAAGIIRLYQEKARAALNAEGAWIGRYEGYVTSRSHDPDRIYQAGFETWRQKFLAEADQERTFEDVVDREEFLRGVWEALSTGVHLTQEGLQGFKDPAFKGPANLAKRVSQARKLHFRDAEAEARYHAEFGRGTLIENVLRDLTADAEQAGLMRHFGTNPRAEFEADLQWLKETRRDDPALVRKLAGRQRALENRFDQLDGTARTPANRLGAHVVGGWRALQAMAKLGQIVASAITDVPLKAAELHYQGVNLLAAYGDGLASVFRGRGTGEARELARLLRGGFESLAGGIAARFDAIDTVPGTLSKLQNVFFKWTGINYWTDAQTFGAQRMMAMHLADHAPRPWAALPAETSRALSLYGIAERDWELVRKADLVTAGGVKNLTPDAALRTAPAEVEALLRLRNIVRADAAPERAAREVARYRQDLALKLNAFFTERAAFAVIRPGAAERAMLHQGTEAGTLVGEAVRTIAQFKAFPVAVITKAWGRELYGRDTRLSSMAGIAHMIVATTAFGYLAMTAKDISKGRTPRDPTAPATWAASFLQGGGAGIYGDFAFGEFNRFGGGFLASVAGPSAGAAEDVMRLWAQARADVADGRPPHRAAQALRIAVNNTPFINLIYTRAAIDYLVLYQVQEALNPGFLRRFERRVKEQNNQTFFLRPTQAVGVR